MTQNKLKGGKADKMSIGDIAKKHKVSIDAIKKEIQIGIGVEKEHTSSKGKEREIVMDHLVEDPIYYSDPTTGLIAKEKESEKRMEKINEETKKLMSLAGIQEGDKKFLTNESFSELDETKKDNDDFIIFEFEQEEVEPGTDDDELYTLK